VIVTRPLREGRTWVRAFAAAGHEAIAFPLIEVAAAEDTLAVSRAWQRLHDLDAVMFVSGNAVDYFFKEKPASALYLSEHNAINLRAYVTGPGSHAALLRAQVPASLIDSPDLAAGQFDSEALWAVVAEQVRPGWRVLIVRGASAAGAPSDEGQGRDWFAGKVLAAGGTVEFVVAYRRRCPVFSAEDRALVKEAASDRSIWLLSSSEAVANLRSAFPLLSWSDGVALATHPRIAEAARLAGFAVVYESRPTLGDLLRSIESVQ
jgi:uroporphyrinogen-III synthase